MKMPNTKSQKNLLIIISDEHRRDAMGCVGHPIVKTPNLDALAARGAVFENAYTGVADVCTNTRQPCMVVTMCTKLVTGIVPRLMTVKRAAGCASYAIRMCR